jgi:hypothetical protein
VVEQGTPEVDSSTNNSTESAKKDSTESCSSSSTTESGKNSSTHVPAPPSVNAIEPLEAEVNLDEILGEELAAKMNEAGINKDKVLAARILSSQRIWRRIYTVKPEVTAVFMENFLYKSSWRTSSTNE